MLQLRFPEDTLARIDSIPGNAPRSAWLHPGLRGKVAYLNQPAKPRAAPGPRSIRIVLTDHCP